MNVIEKMWQEYRKHTFKEDADPETLANGRANFYAGVVAAVSIMGEYPSRKAADAAIIRAMFEYEKELEGKIVANPKLKNNSGLRSDEYLMD